jgi:hypothetical protein
MQSGRKQLSAAKAPGRYSHEIPKKWQKEL